MTVYAGYATADRAALWRLAAIALAALLAAALAGAAAAAPGPAALLPLALVVGAPLLFSARWRFLFVVFGGLATLQSSDSLTASKLAYLAGVAVSVSVALCRFRGLEDGARYRRFRPVLLMFLLFGGMVAFSALAAHAHGVGLTAWLRDGSGYLLFAAIPLLALDLASSERQAFVVGVFVLIGLLSGLAFTIEWLHRRQIIGPDVGLQRVVLQSFLLPASLFAYAASAALRRERGRLGWAVLGACLFAALFVTGTRLSLILLLPLLYTAVAMRGSVLRRVGRVLMFAVAGAAIALLGLLALTKFLPVNSSKLTERFSSFDTLLNDRGSDKSYEERLQQSALLINAFRVSPLIGVGPGYAFVWEDPNGGWQERSSLDSGFAVPAKFGVVGVAALLAVAGGCLVFARRLARAPAAVERDALLGFLVLLVVWFLFGSPFEDKGTSFGLLCLFSLCLLRLRAPRSAAVAPVSAFAPPLEAAWTGA